VTSEQRSGTQGSPDPVRGASAGGASAGGASAGGAEQASWRRQAGFLGAAFAIAAAVIAAGLRFAPQVSAYSGLSPWAFAGALGFVLVLGGACVLFSASLPSRPTAPQQARPQMTAYPAESTSGQDPAVAHSGTPPTVAGRGLTILGATLGLVGLGLAALSVVLAGLLPAPTHTIMVQFTDLYGRVKLEYCPTLPASFAATASQSDLAGSATILPVKVSGETCGNSEYTNGVWIYLNRDAVTISDQP